MKDRFGRTVDYLRLSVTDLCNHRCLYCMPAEGVIKKVHGEVCSLEELEEMAAAAVRLGIRKIRLTGGEPLVRRGIVGLVERLACLEGLEELTMTTNGALLPDLAGPLKAAGLDRLNISLNSLDPDCFRAITRTGSLEQVLAGLEAAEAAGFRETRINTVLLGGINTDEIPALAELARDRAVSVRFIELMPLGAAASLPKERFVSGEAVLRALPQLREVRVSGVSRLYACPGWKGTVGLISPMSCAFCDRCSRIRITADGKLKPCLHSDAEIPLRGLHGEDLLHALREGILAKPARHFLVEEGRSEAHRAMHEIGG